MFTIISDNYLRSKLFYSLFEDLSVTASAKDPQLPFVTTFSIWREKDMLDKSSVQQLSRCYAEMSEGDKSCIAAMLHHSEAEQMTTIGCAHNQFYEELSKLGWAQSAPLPPEMKAFSFARSWRLTPIGFSSLPSLLHLLTTKAL